MNRLSFLDEVKQMLGGENDAFLQGLQDDSNCGETSFKSKIVAVDNSSVTVANGKRFSLTDVYNGFTTHTRHLEIIGGDDGQEEKSKSTQPDCP